LCSHSSCADVRAQTVARGRTARVRLCPWILQAPTMPAAIGTKNKMRTRVVRREKPSDSLIPYYRTGGDSSLMPERENPRPRNTCFLFAHTCERSVTFSSTFCACSKPANPLPRSCNEPCPFEIGKRSRDYRPRGRRVIVATIRGIQPRLADSEQRPCARLSRALTRSSTHKHVHSPRTEGTSAAHQGPYIAQSTIEIIVVIILTAWVE
jgi:hypothetical protein